MATRHKCASDFVAAGYHSSAIVPAPALLSCVRGICQPRPEKWNEGAGAPVWRNGSSGRLSFEKQTPCGAPARTSLAKSAKPIRMAAIFGVRGPRFRAPVTGRCREATEGLCRDRGRGSPPPKPGLVQPLKAAGPVLPHGRLPYASRTARAGDAALPLRQHRAARAPHPPPRTRPDPASALMEGW